MIRFHSLHDLRRYTGIYLHRVPPEAPISDLSADALSADTAVGRQGCRPTALSTDRAHAFGSLRVPRAHRWDRGHTRGHRLAYSVPTHRRATRGLVVHVNPTNRRWARSAEIAHAQLQRLRRTCESAPAHQASSADAQGAQAVQYRALPRSIAFDGTSTLLPAMLRRQSGAADAAVLLSCLRVPICGLSYVVRVRRRWVVRGRV